MLLLLVQLPGLAAAGWTPRGGGLCAGNPDHQRLPWQQQFRHAGGLCGHGRGGPDGIYESGLCGSGADFKGCLPAQRAVYRQELYGSCDRHRTGRAAGGCLCGGPVPWKLCVRRMSKILGADEAGAIREGGTLTGAYQFFSPALDRRRGDSRYTWSLGPAKDGPLPPMCCPAQMGKAIPSRPRIFWRLSASTKPSSRRTPTMCSLPWNPVPRALDTYAERAGGAGAVQVIAAPSALRGDCQRKRERRRETAGRLCLL